MAQRLVDLYAVGDRVEILQVVDDVEEVAGGGSRRTPAPGRLGADGQEPGDCGS